MKSWEALLPSRAATSGTIALPVESIQEQKAMPVDSVIPTSPETNLNSDGDAQALPGSSVLEKADAAQTSATDYAIALGDSFYGTLSEPGDRDWVAVTLEEGITYQISQSGVWGNGGTLEDGYLRLYDASGALIAQNDDGRYIYDAELEYTAVSSGTYFVSVGSHRDQLTGTYRLEVQSEMLEIKPTTPASLEELSDYLVRGYWNDIHSQERSFDLGESPTITVNLEDLTDEGQQVARWALEAWEMVTDVIFQEVKGSANINFVDESVGAYASVHTSGSEIINADINVSSNWLARNGAELNSYSMLTYMHEIGHALGLGHQGDYTDFKDFESDYTFVNDSWEVSVMSYISQQENTLVDASYGLPITPMMSDIMAIQSIYGAPENGGVTAGDTIWGHGSNLGNYMDLAFESFLSGNEETLGRATNFIFTLYDSGGIDTLDLSPLRAASRIDMTDGSFSDIRGRVGALAIAEGTELENLTLGNGHNSVQGNALDNEIRGGTGQDTIDGGAGRDWIWGGKGADSLSGGEGRDVLFGNDHNDLLFGGAGDDLLVGQTGADTLDGGLGNDTLSGGKGADTFRFEVSSGADVIKDFDLASGDTLLLHRTLVSRPIDSLSELRDAYGKVTENGLLLSFETGDTLQLRNIFDFDDTSDSGLAWI